MEGNKYLHYASAWIGVVVGLLAYPLLVVVFGEQAIRVLAIYTAITLVVVSVGVVSQWLLWL